jgi:hypothetical protein
MSIAFHLGLLLLVVWWLQPFSGANSSPAPVFARLIYTLRSEATPDRPAPAKPSTGATAANPTQPINPAGPENFPMAAPAPAPALALKDKTELNVRDNAPVAAPVHPHDATVFILDISGSMYEPYAGSTRLALARRILAQKIAALPDGAPFAVVVYGERTLRSGPLARANDSTRHYAVDFLNHDYDCGGGTDLPAGLATAQELHPGKMLVVTDGDLNMNGPEVLSKTFRILGAKNASPSLEIIGLAPRPHTDATRLLQSIASQQGGTYQTVPNGASLVTSDSLH